MKKEFYVGNRKKLVDSMTKGSLFVAFSGKILRQSADATYSFFANRNFVYLTGLSRENFVLVIEKTETVKETIYILPNDMMAERWNGKRLTPNEVEEISGIENIKTADKFYSDFHGLTISGLYKNLYLDLYKCSVEDNDLQAHTFSKYVTTNYPQYTVIDAFPQLKTQRTIKAPCEIEAMREAVKITRAGILAMMKASRPGMYEYQYKAEFDRALAWNGVLTPAFHSIISAGKNNFCIHYDAYSGKAEDGDMILNDVGAQYDNLVNDVSRGWPANGKFNELQRKVYTVAYETSEHMFATIKPGMPMADVDRLSREFCAEKLVEAGILDKVENCRKYIWHGGAHHIGYDVHDLVDYSMPVTAGMVFCVDVGIYCEDLGIGFRLEDNCLVTENGCENLTASIPRSIEEIEKTMANRD